MEKIKQALERARDTKRSTLRNSQKGVEIRQAPKPASDTKITYSKTKSIKISSEVLKEKRIITGDENDSVSDQYKVLRTHVLQRLRSHKWNSLAITSPNEGCGKTLTAINLAISLAREVNHSVLLVDMDLRRPNIQKYFFSENRPGIGEYLEEEMELSEILFNPGLERLVILPGNKSYANSSEILSSPRMVHLVKEITNRYPNRIVIFDMPPILMCDDMMAFSPYTDANMLVVEEGVTQKSDLKRAYELLDKSNIIGTVLNKSKFKEGIYQYY
ncbi:MAG: CpsD/CapB family tyrosine-protein kinase [Candidatus Thiodiazotropha sp. DIVDIV]